MTSLAETGQRPARPALGTFERYLTLWVGLCILAGIVLGRSRFIAPRVLETIEWSSNAVFAPLYFATAGLSVDIGQLAHPSTLGWFGLLVVVAIASKFAGVYLGVRVSGQPRRESAALGVVLNGRGALQVILATAGLTAGVLNST